MVERKLLLDELEFEYEGLFDAKELFALMDDYFNLKGYDKFEVMNAEQILKEGKELRMKIDFKKWHTEYVRKDIVIEIVMQNMKEIEAKIDTSKVKLNQGNLRMLFTGTLETDYEGRWEYNPVYFFLRTLFDKYVYRAHTKDFENEIKSDVNEIMEKVGSFINLYRYRAKI